MGRPHRKENKRNKDKKDKIKTKRSIRTKVMTMTIVAVFVVMMVCSAIIKYSMDNLTEEILIDVLGPMAKEASKAVEANIHLMADRIISIASDPGLTGKNINKGKARQVLSDATNTYEFYGIGLYNMDGSLVASDGDAYDDISETDFYGLLTESDNMTIADPVITGSFTGLPMAMPVKSGGKTVSYLVGIYKYDMLSEVLSSIHIGHGGSAFIINQNGKIVGHPQEEIVQKELDIYEINNEEKSGKVFDKMVARETGSSDGMIDGQDSYISYCPVRGTRWSFAVKVPKSDYSSSVRFAIYNTRVGTFFALVLALIVVWVVMTVISNQLKRAIYRVNGLADGDLSSPVEVIKSGDEIELLSISLSSTIENINGCFTEIQRVLENISAGNLDISTDGDYRGDFVVVGKALTQITSSLNSIMTQINQTAYQLTNTASSMEIQSKEMHQAATGQTEAMSGLNAEVYKIKENLEAVSKNTKQTHQRAYEIAGRISDGSSKMEELKEAMQAISYNAEDINKITKLIEGIAQQTKILALNATVEAARAGDAGKGFAVVAHEVKELAEKSEKAAQNTVDMIVHAGELIAKGAQLTGAVAQSLEKISMSSDGITKIAGNLSETVNIQESSLKEIMGRMDELSSITGLNLQCAEKTESTGRGLKSESDKLQELLGKFRFQR